MPRLSFQFLLLVTFAAWSYADTCSAKAGTSSSPALWSSSSTWTCTGAGGHTVPTDGDIITINNYVVKANADAAAGDNGLPLYGYIEGISITGITNVGNSACATLTPTWANAGSSAPSFQCDIVNGVPTVRMKNRGAKMTNTSATSQTCTYPGATCTVNYVPASGIAAIAITGTTGKLIIDGATLTVKGSINATSTSANSIELANGAKLVKAGAYRYGLHNDVGSNANGRFYARCDPANPCVIDGFRPRTDFFAGNIDVVGTVWKNIGGEEYSFYVYSGYYTTVSMVQSVLDTCGPAYFGASGS